MARRRNIRDLSQPALFNDLRPPRDIFRYLRNYLAGQVVGATRDDALLDEVLKCLFCKLFLHTRRTRLDKPRNLDAAGAANFYRSVFRKVRTDFPEIYDEGTELLLNAKDTL